MRRVSPGNRNPLEGSVMTQQHQQNHATWEYKYHVVFIPKYRKKTIFGVIKKRLGDVFP